MEFGPRALGGRSILGDPRSPEMQKTLNMRIKYRESFRPFAPVVMLEKVAEWFDFDKESPYMLLTAEVANDKKIHVSKNSEKSVAINSNSLITCFFQKGEKKHAFAV